MQLVGVSVIYVWPCHYYGAVPSYRALWTGLGAQLARDVPFSAICWSTLEPVRDTCSMSSTSEVVHKSW